MDSGRKGPAALEKLEGQLRQSQKMEAIGQLAGGVAHDFNNLLGVIIGYSELLLRDAVKGSPAARRMTEIRTAADRAAALTKQLLAFSRRQVLQPRVLDLNAVVAEAEAMLARVISENVEIVTVLAPGLGRVRADRVDPAVILTRRERARCPPAARYPVDAHVGSTRRRLATRACPRPLLALRSRPPGLPPYVLETCSSPSSHQEQGPGRSGPGDGLRHRPQAADTWRSKAPVGRVPVQGLPPWRCRGRRVGGAPELPCPGRRSS